MRWWCDPSPDGTLWLNPIFPKNVFFRKRRFLPKAVAIPQGWVGIEGLNPMKQKCGYSLEITGGTELAKFGGLSESCSEK